MRTSVIFVAEVKPNGLNPTCFHHVNRRGTRTHVKVPLCAKEILEMNKDCIRWWAVIAASKRLTLVGQREKLVINSLLAEQLS